MKIIALFSFVALLVFSSCSSQPEVEIETISYAVFGDTITADGALSAQEMFDTYQNLKEGDTVEVKFTSTIYNVCQKKGCWMNVDLTEEEVAFIRFKDYGFFMPFNAAESRAVINGKAFLSIISIDDLKHYAEDEGLSQEEIDAIDEPEITYSFLANGVLIEE